MKVLITLTAIVLCLTVLATNGDEKTHRDGVTSIVEELKKAWNQQNLPEFIDLFHKDSDIRKGWQEESKREQVSKAFAQMFENLGQMKKHELGTYIERKDRVVLKIEYSKQGLIPGTMAMAKEGVEWKILDWNIDGQGEKELNE